VVEVLVMADRLTAISAGRTEVHEYLNTARLSKSYFSSLSGATAHLKVQPFGGFFVE
jgi:hypothetical protein